MFYLALFLTLLSGLCWTLTYFFSIRVGFQDKLDAMPFLALALNIAWEALYTVTGLYDSLTNVQAWVNLVWVAFDVVLLYIYFKFAGKEFRAPKKYFIPWSVFGLVMAFVLQIVFLIGFGTYDLGTANLGILTNLLNPHLGCWYSAFIQNLVMSFLYIGMFIRRRGAAGQRLTIAVSKCIGTFAPTIMYGVMLGDKVVLALGLFTFVLDVIYIWMVSRGEKFFAE